MKSKNFFRYLAAIALATSAFEIQNAQAQFTTPNLINNNPNPVVTTLGETTFTNYGLVGVGRISGTTLDTFGETFGSVSSLQITNWLGNSNSGFTGTFNILPDRGYNNNNAGGFFSDYAARIQTVNFSFTPYTGPANIGGSDIATKMAAQNQITFTSPINGVKFTYNDPTHGVGTFTTGLDPGAAGSTTLFGKTVPYVINYNGSATPGAPFTNFNNINKLAIDAEGLVLKSDGSGYVSDEYGANVYYFNANKEIVGVITPPAAVAPRSAGNPNFISTVAPDDGRRNNQGLEGVALSPDGKKLFTLLQSATVQDSGNNQQDRLYTRLAVYNVASNATPGAPESEYVLKLPTYTLNGGGGAVNATAAQSEIIALDDHRILVLSRDANGQGSATTNKTVFKSVLLVDTSVNAPTNIAGTSADDPAGKVTSSVGVINPSITALTSAEALNMLNVAQLNKFNINLDAGGANQVTKLTLGEKWEGMSLVSANDPLNPFDYYLFIANDNDFLTSQGKMIGPDGVTMVDYNAFTSHPAARIPTGADGATTIENDTMFLAFRVTIVPEPASLGMLTLGALALLARRRRA